MAFFGSLFDLSVGGLDDMKTAKDIFMEIYERLLARYGPRKWWPVTPDGETRPRYTGGPGNERQRFEVAVGAVLTQNTAWKNAAKAIEMLNKEALMSPERLSRVDAERLAGLIRSAGYFNQKAKRLVYLARFFLKTKKIDRDNLLSVNGIGPETADSILLYGFGLPYFVVDAYTRRIFGRIGIVDPAASYDEIQSKFERRIPGNVHLYQEYHALIVEHGKGVCRAKPLCQECVLSDVCNASADMKKG